MNADTDKVMVEDITRKSGMSFRRSGPRVTSEAINDGCVCNAQFNIKNSAGQLIHRRFEFYSHRKRNGSTSSVQVRYLWNATGVAFMVLSVNDLT
jgi:hypothetical protein